MSLGGEKEKKSTGEGGRVKQSVYKSGGAKCRVIGWSSRPSCFPPHMLHTLYKVTVFHLPLLEKTK